MTKWFILLSIIVGGISFLVIAVFLKVPQPKNDDTKTQTIAYLDDIPPLFPQVSWEEFIADEGYKSLGEQGLYSQKDIYGSIRMNGKEWIASKSNLSRDSMNNLLKDFGSYYDNKLSAMGWDAYYEDKKYNFSPLAADGPGGSMWGYVKVKDGRLSEVLLATFTPIEDFGGMATCPCDVGFRVFVSEAVPLEELIRRVEE